MNTKVLFYLKKFKEAQESEVPDLLIEAMKALPEYVVGYNLENKQVRIEYNLRGTLINKIKSSGMNITGVAKLLNINRGSLQMFLTSYDERALPYEHIAKLLALFDEPCIAASELRDFLLWDESNEIMFDDKGFFDMREEGKEYSAEEVIERFRAAN